MTQSKLFQFDIYQVKSGAMVDKYIDESDMKPRTIRELFQYAKDHQPCIIFMDEIDAIVGRRFWQGTQPIAKFREYSWRYIIFPYSLLIIYLSLLLFLRN